MAEVKHWAMKIKFEIRTTKKVKEGEMVPLYVRMVDGRAFHQAGIHKKESEEQFRKSRQEAKAKLKELLERHNQLESEINALYPIPPRIKKASMTEL